MKKKSIEADRSFLVICAARYCLGRRSYIVGMMCDYLKQNAKQIHPTDREVIIKDIERQKIYGYGDDCDRDNWLEAKRALRGAGNGVK